MGHAAGAKGGMRVFTIDLEEGKKRSQKCKSSWEFLKDENLLLVKHEWLQWEQEREVGGLRQDYGTNWQMASAGEVVTPCILSF